MRGACAPRVRPVAVSQLLPVLTVVFGVRLGCAWLGSVPDDNWDNGEDGGGWDMAGDADGEAAPRWSISGGGGGASGLHDCHTSRPPTSEIH